MSTPLSHNRRDATLRWTMRGIGLVLALGSLFFLHRNLGFGPADDWFLAGSALLGGLTFGASWLPGRLSHRARPQTSQHD